MAIVNAAAESLQLLRSDGSLRNLDSLAIMDLLTEVELRGGVSFSPDAWPSDFTSTEAIALALLKANPDGGPDPDGGRH